jgi:hypothetical protein
MEDNSHSARGRNGAFVAGVLILHRQGVRLPVDAGQSLVCPDGSVLKLPRGLPGRWSPIPLELPRETLEQWSRNDAEGAAGKLRILLGCFGQGPPVQLRVDLDCLHAPIIQTKKRKQECTVAIRPACSARKLFQSVKSTTGATMSHAVIDCNHEKSIGGALIARFFSVATQNPLPGLPCSSRGGRRPGAFHTRLPIKEDN